MDNKSQFLSVFCAYIKQYIKVLLLFIVFALVFCIVFSLYNLETEAIYYSIILCAFIGLIYICINVVVLLDGAKLLLLFKSHITLMSEIITSFP